MGRVSVYEVIQRLPEIAKVRKVSRALAVLDLILDDDPGSRYYAFDARWSPTEEAALMDNGSGDQYSVVFSPAGAFARGFAHESAMSPYANGGETWPGLFDGVPAVFHGARDEPAFQDEEGRRLATICFWRGSTDSSWATGPIELPADKPFTDGADPLFEILADGRPEAYLTFAEDYHEVALDLEAVRHVYALMPLTEYVVTSLNPNRRLADLSDDLAEIGYPRS